MVEAGHGCLMTMRDQGQVAGNWIVKYVARENKNNESMVRSIYK